MDKLTKQSRGNEGELVYSPEKVSRFLHMLFNLRFEVIDDPISEKKLDEEIKAFTIRLRKKYPNTTQYAMMHALMGSTIDLDDKIQILYEDFPGDDSVEKFIAGLGGKI